MQGPFCAYRHLFGEPRQGIHAYRILDVAVFDVAVTVAVAAGTSYAFRWPFLYVLVAWFVLGIVVHRMFCVKTTVDR